jgi:uncharacterized YigZ family protein
MQNTMNPAPDDEIWITPAGPGRAEIKVRGSRFMADVTSAEDEEATTLHLQQLRQEFPRATHHCWGFRLRTGNQLVERASDAGEPSGTAGAPILRAMQSALVERASCIVVRWFGGTKLGVGPLARAYRDAATAGLMAAGTTRRRHLQVISVTFPHDLSSDVRRALALHPARILREEHGAAACLQVGVPLDRVTPLTKAITDASRGQAQLTPEELITVAVEP